MIMGAVAMSSKNTGWDKGYPIMEATLYIYCDACGSFNIKTYIPFIKILIIAVVLMAAIFIVLIDIQNLLCLAVMGLFTLFLPWNDILLKYMCRKCGNKHIS
jgi:hypothetical protein